VTGAPSRSPPYRREDAAGLQHADPGMLRKKQEIFSALSTIDEHRQEVKSIDKMNREER
jgi:hypothetical protein